MALQPLFPGKVFYRVQFSCMLVICSVTDILSTPTITEPPSVECQDLLFPHRSMHMSWEQECQDLFRRTRAAQNVAPEGIRTRHLPHAKQALYHYATAPPHTYISLQYYKNVLLMFQQLVACSMLSALLNEYSSSSRMSSVGFTWEFHMKCKKVFEVIIVCSC